MIRLLRVRTKQAIPIAFRGVKRIEKALTLLVEAESKRTFDSGYWKKAKKQLKSESSDTCAYCEAPTTVVAHGDMEHLRWKTFQKLDVFRKAFASPAIDDALREEIHAMLRLMMQDDAPYAGMCRYFVRQVWQVPLCGS